MTYASDRLSAAKDILKNGFVATLSRQSGGTLNPATGIVSGDSTQTQSVPAIKLPAAGGKIQALDNIPDGQTLVERNTAYLLIGALKSDLTALDWAPEYNDQVTINSVNWNVSGVTEIAPDGQTAIIYKVAVSR